MVMRLKRREAMAAGTAFGLAATGLLTGRVLAQDTAAETTTEGGAGPNVEPYVMGDADAPVHVIEYASLTCPHCATFHTDVLPRLREDYIDTGKVRFEFREVYFDRLGLWGGMLARCGGGMRYFGIVDLLLKRQPEWTRASSGEEAIAVMRRIGLQAGLTEAQMDECLRDAELAEALVARYQQHIEEHPITGTPSFVIEGELLSNMSYDAFRERLDAALG